jgi:hypothetical protein
MKTIIIFLLLVVLSGCGAKQTILVDGMPAPESTHVFRDIETNTRIEANVASFIWEKPEDKEKGREYLYPAKYLEINNDQVVEIPRDTVYVGGTVRIINPERSYYFLKAEYLFKEGGQSKKVSRMIYHGDGRGEVFNVGRDVDSFQGIICLRVIFYPENMDSDIEMETCYKQTKER